MIIGDQDALCACRPALQHCIPALPAVRTRTIDDAQVGPNPVKPYFSQIDRPNAGGTDRRAFDASLCAFACT
jgi:hypothetical protein